MCEKGAEGNEGRQTGGHFLKPWRQVVIAVSNLWALSLGTSAGMGQGAGGSPRRTLLLRLQALLLHWPLVCH